MSSISKALLAAFIIFVIHFSMAQDAKVQSPRQTTFVTIPLSFTVNASPAEVWKTLMSIEGFCTLTGFKADTGDRKKSFGQLGDQVGAQIASDTGHLVVVYLTPDKELRTAFEPANGGYLRQIRFLIKSAEEASTVVDYWDRFTVDQPETDETIKKTSDELLAGVERFRALVEKKTKK